MREYELDGIVYGECVGRRQIHIHILSFPKNEFNGYTVVLVFQIEELGLVLCLELLFLNVCKIFDHDAYPNIILWKNHCDV